MITLKSLTCFVVSYSQTADIHFKQLNYHLITHTTVSTVMVQPDNVAGLLLYIHVCLSNPNGLVDNLFVAREPFLTGIYPHP